MIHNTHMWVLYDLDVYQYRIDHRIVMALTQSPWHTSQRAPLIPGYSVCRLDWVRRCGLVSSHRYWTMQEFVEHLVGTTTYCIQRWERYPQCGRCVGSSSSIT